jgi:hypothetical protein
MFYFELTREISEQLKGVFVDECFESKIINNFRANKEQL